MININNLALALTERLNTALTSDAPMNNIEKHISYEFNIVQDTDEYKSFDRAGNDIRRYINGVMSIVSNDVVSIAEDANNDPTKALQAFSADVAASVELIVPITAKKRSLNDLLCAVRNHIESVLQVNSQSTVIYDGMAYLQLIRYALPLTGVRTQVPMVGDSIVLQMDILYSFVAQGIAPDSYKIFYIDDNNTEHRIYYQRCGFARRTISEQATPSKPGNDLPTSQNVPSSTLFSINLDLIARLTPFDDLITEYTIKKKVAPFSIRVETPMQDKTASETFTMMFDSAGLNGQIESISSISVTLTEYIDI